MPATVERTIANGAARKYGRLLAEFDASAEYVSSHYDELLATYEGRWIAASRDGVVAASTSRAGLRRLLSRRPQKGNTLYVTFLTRERQTLIL